VNSTIDSEDRRVLRSRILYENNELIVIDKPAGMAVQGGTGQRRHVDGLSSVLVAGNEPPPKLVHRLDKDTSGVLLLAKSAKAARRLGREFKMGKVRKTYWAVVVGVPALAAGIIENGLEKRAVAGGERVIVVSNRGRPARTRYKILDQSGSLATLLALYPETGRTHQLRVHCLGLGTPILGDGKYGGRKSFLPDLPAARRLHLHARSMELPIGDGTDLRLVAPRAGPVEKISCHRTCHPPILVCPAQDNGPAIDGCDLSQDIMQAMSPKNRIDLGFYNESVPAYPD
jgi:23S rRNA pseudouridine955/2504/2580 synthase